MYFGSPNQHAHDTEIFCFSKSMFLNETKFTNTAKIGIMHVVSLAATVMGEFVLIALRVSGTEVGSCQERQNWHGACATSPCCSLERLHVRLITLSLLAGGVVGRRRLRAVRGPTGQRRRYHGSQGMQPQTYSGSYE